MLTSLQLVMLLITKTARNTITNNKILSLIYRKRNTESNINNLRFTNREKSVANPSGRMGVNISNIYQLLIFVLPNFNLEL